MTEWIERSTTLPTARSAPSVKRVQRSFIVGGAADPAERDADVFADRLMAEIDAAPASSLAAASDAGATRIRRRVEVGAAGGELDESLTRAVDAEASGGQQLAPQLRGRIERAAGVDLGGVRVHTDSAVAPRIGASAFTHGNHIHLASGRYQPDAADGMRLIAHELGHVIQQGAAQAVVHRMWDLDRYDTDIPKHKGWLIQAQIRDDIERYFRIVKHYPKSFKTRAEADRTLADTLVQAQPIIDRIRSQVDVYRKGMVHEKQTLDPNSAEFKDFGERIKKAAIFFNHLSTTPDNELRARHHDAVMGILVSGTGSRVVSEKDRQGKAVSGAAKGGVNTLGKATYAVGGRNVTGYTKMDRPNTSDPGDKSGISIDQAKMSLRAVATFKVSELLNLGLVPETVLLTEGTKTGQLMAEAHGSPGQGLMPGGEFGPKNDEVKAKVQKLLDKLAKQGLSAAEKKAITKEMGEVAEAGHGVTVIGGKIYELGSVVADFDWWDPAMQRHLNALQFFDLLVGHADRHSGNYIIDFDPASANKRVRGIKGIDNDDTWGQNMTAANMGRAAFGKTPMPAIVDVNTAVRFLLADWNQISGILTQFTMTPAEIGAAQGRFTAVQAHIRALATSGHLATYSGTLEPEHLVALQSVGINPVGLAAPMQWGAGTQAVSDATNSYSGIQSQEKTLANQAGTALYQPVYQ